jgi:hypothetical protein
MVVRKRDILIFVLVSALAYVAYRDYEANRDFKRICDLTGPHDVVSVPPHTEKQKIDNLCSCRLDLIPNVGCSYLRKYFNSVTPP